MRFLALSPAAGLALLVAVGLVILAAYLARAQRRQVVVASNLIWRRVVSGAPRRRERWRWLVSLLLALAIGLSIALALTRPEVAAVAGLARRVVLVMDNAPSMAARTTSGETRWQRAVSRAHGLIGSAGPAAEIAVVDTMGQVPSAVFGDAKAARATLARLGPIPAGTARMPWLPPLAAGPVARDERIVITDGVAPLEIPVGARLEPVFEVAANAAVLSLEARPQPRDPTRYEALVQLLNASNERRKVTLELSGDGFAASGSLDMPAGQMLYPVFDVSSFAGGLLKARVRMADDALPIDDAAYALVAPHSPRPVVLVTVGNAWLAEALRLLPGVTLTVVTPDEYPALAVAPAAAASLWILDDFLPLEPPAGPTLLFSRELPQWMGEAATESGEVAVTRWDANHPLAQDIAWRDLHVRQAGLARLGRPAVDAATSPAPPASVVIARGTAEGALVSAGESPRRWIRVGFALRDSSLPHLAGFPVFVSHALDWLTPRAAPQAGGLGLVDLPWADATVTDDAGRPVAVTRTAVSARFEARASGLYRARVGTTDHAVIVNPLDPALARVNLSPFAGAAVGAEPAAARRPPSPVEPWTLLLALALALLAAEWLTFSRRWTV